VHRPNLKSVALPVPEIIVIGVFLRGGGLRTHKTGEEEAVARTGSEMVPFERTFVSSDRPSIVTFPLSLRVSDGYCAFVPARHFFPLYL